MNPPHCPLCDGSAGNDVIGAAECMYGTGGQFTYRVCASCATVWQPEPPADMGRFYPEDYSGFGVDDGGSLVARASTARDRRAMGVGGRLAGAIAEWVLPDDPAREGLAAVARTGVPRGARILDVGCGSGTLLARLRAVGFTDLTGVDPFAGATLDLPGLRIIQGHAADMDGTFDLVMFNHSFEHVPDPRDALATARALLAPGGRLLIRTPVADCWALRHYGSCWVQLDAPRHLCVSSRAGLVAAAAGAGLERLDVVSDSTAFQFWGSEQYVRGVALMDPRSHLRNPRGSLFSRRTIATYARWARTLNELGEGDQVAAVFRPA